MLASLEVFANKHSNTSGYKKVIDDLSGKEVRKQKGADFVIRVTKNKNATKFEYKYSNSFDNTVDFVLGGKNIDGKSWSVDASINKVGSLSIPTQLVRYFKDGKDFEMWFDYVRFQKSPNGIYKSMSKAQATEHIKKQYQKRFQKNNYEAFVQLKNSQWLMSNNIYDADDFQDAVDDLSHNFYSFVQVR